MLLQRVVSGTDPEYAATRRLCSEDTSAEDLVGLLQVRVPLCLTLFLFFSCLFSLSLSFLLFFSDLFLQRLIPDP